MKQLLQQIRQCKVCEAQLELGARPVVAASPRSKIIIVGQAPGRIVHQTGIPWNDKSGHTLRQWLEIDDTQFYDTDLFALMPMGFCFPGKGTNGDMPPRPECAPLWHQKLLDRMPHVQLILLIGQYAQNYYLAGNAKATLTETVRHFRDYLPLYFPLPHPSPRNNIWQARNAWFSEELLPQLKVAISRVLG